MVDRSYMLAQPTRPSPVKVAFDQRVVPALIDAAGAVEGRVEAVSVVVKRAPVRSLLIAAGVGFLVVRAARVRLPG